MAVFTVSAVVLSYLVLTVSSSSSSSSSSSGNATKTCVDYYIEGVEAYLDERWQDCVDAFQRAVTEYRAVRRKTIHCRLKCEQEASASPYMMPYDVEHLHFYESLVRKTLCLLKCKNEHFKDTPSTFPMGADVAFSGLKPYEYLHLCYYQNNMPQEAANAAFTFLVGNPDHQIMIGNFKFYSTLEEVNMAEVENYEAKNHVSLYIHGSVAYDKGDFKSVISYFEMSLQEYLKEMEECRAYCEGPFDQGWFPDYTSSTANHFTFCLKCKRDCRRKLNTLNGEKHEDLLASYFHYLQFAYHRVGKLKKACEAVQTYLLLSPHDTTMLNNKMYYTKLDKVRDSYFAPRKEIVKYSMRQEYEDRLLNFIETEFKVDGNKTANSTNEIENTKTRGMKKKLDDVKLTPPPIIKFQWSDNSKNIPFAQIKKHENDSIVDEKLLVEHKNSTVISVEDEVKMMKQRAVQQIKRAAEKKIKVIMGENELRGKFRFLADGFAKEDECKRLIEMAQIAAVQGDGYIDNKSPHSQYEKFEGLTLGRAALLVYFGLMEVSDLGLYLNISECGRDYVERYFNLKKQLFFNFSHLVCRTALSSPSGNNSFEMSHAVHADNCNLLHNGTCTKVAPAYTWRDYSAIIYLNDDFEGGEFIFAGDVKAKSIQSVVRPRCGRCVGFSAGVENLHGVNGVRRGSRCALALWFTFNATHKEKERTLAIQMFNLVQQHGTVTEKLLKDLKKYVTFDTLHSKF